MPFLSTPCVSLLTFLYVSLFLAPKVRRQGRQEVRSSFHLVLTQITDVDLFLLLFRVDDKKIDDKKVDDKKFVLFPLSPPSPPLPLTTLF